MKKIKDAKALREVWEWKEKAYREVEGLELDEALKRRIQDSLETSRKLNITFDTTREGVPTKRHYRKVA
jgi:hypothetical protein